jgi:site-specific DNA-cytosine methylase
MIILPKSDTSAFVADTKALGLDSEEFSQICEKSLTWRGKDSLSRTWLQRWKRVTWMQPLSSRTLKPSLTESFVEKWTSSLGDSRASLSAKLESVKQLMTHDTSSLSSQMESENANPQLSFSKMWKGYSVAEQETENQFSNMSSEHWKDLGYRATAGIFSAREVGAPHQRKRVFILGVADCDNGLGNRSELEICTRRDAVIVSSEELADRASKRGTAGLPKPQQREEGQPEKLDHCCRGERWPARPSELQHEWEEPRVVADTQSQQSASGNHGSESGATCKPREGEPRGRCSGSLRESNGQAESRLGRATDAASSWVDPTANRVDRLRLLGNGVVPATAAKAFVTLLQRLNP